MAKPKLTPAQESELLAAWDTGLESTGTLAKRFPLTPQGIRLLLRRHGRNTSKAASIQYLPCDNPACTNTVRVLRMRRRTAKHHYCHPTCYYAVIHNPNYLQNRRGQRIARKVMHEVFPLHPQHVVHHVDGNTTHNNLTNLMVFATHADHMRWHRAGGPASGVIPLYDPNRTPPILIPSPTQH